MLGKHGLQARLASDPPGTADGAAEIIVLNRLGVLKELYLAADAVFMGGSLVPRGGQNPVEPAAFKRPIVHGPQVFNFAKIYETLDDEGGAVRVRDEEELAFACLRLLTSLREREKVGANAFQALYALRGATERHLDWLAKFLGVSEDLERTKHV
jgi:3-deoxy-D-manno-octulosonic-acid transferase